LGWLDPVVDRTVRQHSASGNVCGNIGRVEASARKRVVVSGANGFIGGHLCDRLIRDGMEVHGLSRLPAPRPVDGLRWWQVDLADADSAQALIRDLEPEVFFHLASFVTGSRELSAVFPTFRDNLGSTINLLISLAEVGCERCVLAGSLEEPDENSGVLVPGSPYAAAKISSSLYARMFHELYQLPVVMARLFMVYGPRQHDFKKVIPYTITSLLKKKVPQFSSGLRPVDWIYVDDVVEGLIAAGVDRQDAGYTVDLGSGALVTIRDVVLEIARLMGAKNALDFGSVPERPMERVRKADTAATRSRLGATDVALGRIATHHSVLPVPRRRLTDYECRSLVERVVPQVSSRAGRKLPHEVSS
jgi:nucleoside-diphosphate-sugar epimerase